MRRFHAFIFSHLFSEKHSKYHKSATGCAIVFIGFALMHNSIEIHAVRVCVEFVGVSLHTIGATPILESFAKRFL